jgi:hypothetical protein
MLFASRRVGGAKVEAAVPTVNPEEAELFAVADGRQFWEPMLWFLKYFFKGCQGRAGEQTRD